MLLNHVLDSNTTPLSRIMRCKPNIFKRIKATEKEGVIDLYDNLHNGLRVLDSGFENTAVKELDITFVSPPMVLIIAGLAALETCLPEYIPAYKAENLHVGKTAGVDHQIIRTIASLAAISAMFYCHHQQRRFTPPDVNCSYIENILLMMGHVEEKTARPSPTPKYIQTVGNAKAEHNMIEGVKVGKGRLFGYGHRIYKTIDPRYESIPEILNEL
ncbi:MAG: hypothetical protein Q9195_009011 [Heterodermia aff. obscurata]